MYLLDTNVLSDSLRNQRYPNLTLWLARQPATDLFVSSVSLGELAYGVYRLADGKRKAELLADLQRVRQHFAERILSVDASVALSYGEHQAKQVSEGRNDDPFDSLIIATAKKHDLVVATRNLKHYEARGVGVVNPY